MMLAWREQGTSAKTSSRVSFPATSRLDLTLAGRMLFSEECLDISQFPSVLPENLLWMVPAMVSPSNGAIASATAG